MRKVYLALLLIMTGMMLAGTSMAQPVISYSPVVPSCAGSNVMISGVTITDASGIALSGSTVPRVYYRKGAALWTSVAGTYVSGTSTSSVWDFTIDVSVLGSTAAGNTLSYFVIAESAGGVSATPGTGLVASGVNSVSSYPTDANTFTVSSKPILASLTASPTAPCIGIPFTLTSGGVSGTGSLVSYNWSGPAGYNTTGTASSVVINPVSTSESGTYSLTVTYPGDGCTSAVRQAVVTVNSAMPAVTGAPAVCAGGTTTYSIATTGGTWSSSNTAVATINSLTGLVTGAGAGTTSISYIKGSCYSVATLTVNAVPSAISGFSNVCVGSSTTLTDADGGGTWSSSNASIGSVDAVSGVVTGIANGSINISYTFSTGCYRTFPMTVNVVPAAISGTTVVCEASTTNLVSSPTGGSWVSDNSAVASVGAGSGIVSGVSTGTANISYVIGGAPGCIAATTVTVNPRPLPITGSALVCVGSTTALSDLTPAGTWSSANPAIATVDVAGVVTGVSASVVSISYTLSTGCARTAVVTVNPIPGAITGSPSICMGYSVNMASYPYTGTWSTSDAVVAPVSATGVVTGASIGTAIITNAFTTGCYRTVTVTVNVTPDTIAGTPAVCSGMTAILTDATPGGVWSAPTGGSILSVGASTGTVTGGLSAGTAPVSYVLSNGCFATVQVTNNTSPAAIGGSSTVCIGSNITLTNAVPGGTWESSDPTKATISSTSGLVNGISAGTTTISYYTGAGCMATRVLTVNSLPAAISGSLEICSGTSTTLTSATAGGSWYTSTSTVASISTTTGLVNAGVAGTATISYRLPTGCMVTAEMTVDPLPSAIAGSNSVCVGYSTLLSSGTPGGTWSSSNIAVGTVDATSGSVTGLSTGTTVIYYTSPLGCTVSKVVTANAVPGAIGGGSAVCVGSIVALSSPTSGGAWSSSDPLVATINSSGFINGLSAGVVNVTYTLPNTCFVTAPITVNPTPDPITGTATTCVGSTSALATLSSGGVWSTGNPAVATVDAAGLVTGIGNGVTNISYTLPTGCRSTMQFTVNATPTAITGSLMVCEGFTTNLSSMPTGGTWTSSNPLVANVTSSGVVTGISAGTTGITYALSTGCSRVVVVTVNNTPGASTGTAAVCIGSTTTLTNATSGGTWTSSNTSVATVGATTGVVTGVAASIANITYALPTGCRAVTPVVVNANPGTINGTISVCMGNTSTLTNATVGGTWMSSDVAVATIGSSSGVVVTNTVGTTTITYMIATTGCFNTKVLTVNPVPGAIVGVDNVCLGSSTTLSNAMPGGTWSTSNPSVASVNTTTGLVTGISAGTANITYKMGTGCYAIQPMTVNALPAALTGTPTACVGTSTVFSSATPGGLWTSSDNTIAQVGTSGVVTGFSNGSAVISYSMPTGCFVTRSVTIYNAPSPIAGTLVVCQGETTHLSSLTPSGTWSSSIPTIASVGPTGIVTGLVNGTTIITYTTTSGCTTTAIVTVNSTPAGISGFANLCVGSITTLSSLTTGGTWSSGNPVVASVDASTGVVTGVTTGTARITYTIASGCRTTQVVTVSAMPANILGVSAVCAGSTINLTNATGGGTWSTTDVTIATVTSAGVVNGVSAGNVTISYTLATGCASTKNITVNPLPAAIGGIAEVCAGSNTTLTNDTAGGIWTSSSVSVATIDVSTGVLHGVNAGTSIITYSVPTGCRVNVVATVYALPGAISGVTNLCTGTTITMTNPVAGGLWSSDNLGAAVIDPATGVATGTGPGLVHISYTMPGGCSTSIVVTVTPAPSPIDGDLNLCAGETSLLTNPSVGGTWVSTNPSVASIDLGSGLVTSYAAGSTVVTYTLGVGCNVVTTVNVSPSPSVITGPSEVCMGHVVTLYNAVAGGTWISTDVSVASVESTTGVVTGIANNTVEIRYQLPGGCYASFPMTVNATPNVIAGADSVCEGLTTVLMNSVPGGIWTSSDPSVAPIDLLSGVVTGISVGTATVSYTIVGTGCYRNTVVTVNANPAPIAGATNTCVGSFTLLTDATVGGTWSSSNLAVAAVGSGTGIVTGLGEGTATITYTLPTGCIATTLVVVNPAPMPITGIFEVCVGSETTLASASPFGTWSSSTANATIGSTSGTISGITAGTTVVTYQLLTTGCYATQMVTINPLPPAIIGIANICFGSTTFFTDAASGGAWSSSDPGVATIDAFGGVNSVSVGSTIISYTLTSACYRTQLLNVEPTLNAIVGVSRVCEGSDIILSNDYSGGVWTSSNSSTASVSTSGIVTGVSAGPVTITYSTPLANCYVTHALTVDPVPAAIVGADSVCEGSTTAFTDVSIGGVWSSSDATVASVDASGMVTGVAPSTAIISYSLPTTGCAATKEIFVKSLAHAGTISGSAFVCLHSTVTLSNTATDGVWSSNDATIASIDASGVVTGEAVGNTVISYIVTNTCSADTTTFNMEVKPLPDAGIISGAAAICVNYDASFTSTVPGGVWSISDTSIATIDATGVVFAVAEGTVTVSYAVTTVCGTDYATKTVAIHILPPHSLIAIHPDSVLCRNSLYLNFGAADAPPAGFSYTWNADNAIIYATSPDGQNALVNFTTSGTAIVRLTTNITSTGCFVTDSFVATVNTDSAYMPEVKYYANELICTDNTADSYQWGYDDATTLDSTIIPGATMQSYYLPVPDFTGKRYWVIATHHGCPAKVYYIAPTNIGTVGDGNMSVRLFPNPADTKINIEVTGLSSNDEVTVRMVDMMGKDLGSIELTHGKGSLDVSNLASGVYSVMFMQNGVKVAGRTFVKN